jgi:hypothetical protein
VIFLFEGLERCDRILAIGCVDIATIDPDAQCAPLFHFVQYGEGSVGIPHSGVKHSGDAGNLRRLGIHPHVVAVDSGQYRGAIGDERIDHRFCGALGGKRLIDPAAP